MLGHGPLGVGYSLIATENHIASMMDLSAPEKAELQAFEELVRQRINPRFGPYVTTEHGRVPVCINAATNRHEPHCLHAHRLLFPGISEITKHLDSPITPWAHFEPGASSPIPSGQYLWCRHDDGRVDLASVNSPLPRQFFRSIVALERGTPELADWTAHPGWELIREAQERLGMT